jgi:hypothetical protein
MILLTTAQLDELVETSIHLTPERRRFFVDMLCDLSAEDRENYLEAYAETMENDEFVFVRSCFGEAPPLQMSEPSEQPLIPQHHATNRS